MKPKGGRRTLAAESDGDAEEEPAFGDMAHGATAAEVTERAGATAAEVTERAGATAAEVTERARPRIRLWPHQPRHRRLVATLGVLVGAVVGVAVLGAVALLQARGPLEGGAAAARTALAAARSGHVAEATQQLRSSEASFLAGRLRLHVWWARPAALLPVERQNMEAADTMAASAVALIHRGEPILQALAGDRNTMTGGQVPLDQIRALEGMTATGAAAAAASEVQIDKARSAMLLPPIASQVADMQAKLREVSNSLTDALDTERLLVSMLGGEAGSTTRRYFVAFTTPSELRGATGIIANYGEVTADDGRLALTRFGRMEELASHAPATPNGPGWDPQFAATYGSILTGTLWQNVTISPDFPTTARAIEALYPESGGEAVNGVIAIDPEGLSALLALEGPVTVPEWPQPITAGSVVGILEHQQYNQIVDTNRRVAFLSDLAAAVIDGMNHQRTADMVQLARMVGSALRGKHLLLASSYPDEEATLVRLGVAGALPGPGGDRLGVFSVNASTNKADWYLRREIDDRVVVTRCCTSAVVTITLRNEAPDTGQAAAILQGTPGAAAPGHNHQILSVLTPWTFGSATVNGTPATVNEAPWAAMNLFSMLIDIPPGSVAIVQLRLSGSRPETRYGLELVEQPIAHPDSFHLDWIEDGSERRVQIRAVESDLRFG